METPKPTRRTPSPKSDDQLVTEFIIGDNHVVTEDEVPDELEPWLAEHDAFADGPDA